MHRKQLEGGKELREEARGVLDLSTKGVNKKQRILGEEAVVEWSDTRSKPKEEEKRLSFVYWLLQKVRNIFNDAAWTETEH